MNEKIYRHLCVKLGEFAKMIQQDLDLKKYPEMESDRMMICFKIREINGFLRDMMNVTDIHENPNKVMAEFTPKERANNVDGSGSETGEPSGRRISN